MLHIAICDDEARDRAELRALIEQTPGCRRANDLNVSEYAGGEQFLLDVEDGRGAFDLLFLDIFMSGLNGLETARQLRGLGNQTPLVFLTSSPDYAVESYDVEAAGYLLKPPRLEKVGRLMEKLLTPPARPRLAVKSAGRRQYCEYDDILYLESADKVTLIHLLGGETIPCRERLSALEEALHDRRFLRCHQSFLVNMDHVKSADREFHLSDGSEVPIRIHGRREIADAYYRYFVAHTVSKLPGEEDVYV